MRTRAAAGPWSSCCTSWPWTARPLLEALDWSTYETQRAGDWVQETDRADRHDHLEGQADLPRLWGRSPSSSATSSASVPRPGWRPHAHVDGWVDGRRSWGRRPGWRWRRTSMRTTATRSPTSARAWASRAPRSTAPSTHRRRLMRSRRIIEQQICPTCMVAVARAGSINRSTFQCVN